MDFKMYPRDDHVCSMKIGSKTFGGRQIEFSAKIVRTRYQAFAPLPFSLEFSETWNGTYNYGEASYSTAGFDLHLSRAFSPFAFNFYMPTGLLVIASWIGFVIPAEMVPGRMALLVTTLLGWKSNYIPLKNHSYCRKKYLQYAVVVVD